MRSELENYSLPDKPVQEQWDHLENTLKSLMNKYIPQKVPRRQKHKPWITRDLITELHQRNRAFRKWKKTQSDDHYAHYLKLRSTCQKNIRNANSDYIRNIFNLENPDEPDKSKVTKRFWTYVKSKKKDSCCVSPLKSEGVIVSDAKGNWQTFSIASTSPSLEGKMTPISHPRETAECLQHQISRSQRTASSRCSRLSIPVKPPVQTRYRR